MSIVIVATVKPKQEYIAELRDSLTKTVERVRAEDAGCESYALSFEEATGTFVFVERWADEAAIAAHSSSPAFVEFLATIDGKLDEPLVVRQTTPII